MRWNEVVETHYPDAKPGPEVTETFIRRLEDDYGADPSRTLLASCFCPDELTRKTTFFQKRFHGPFFLSGLAGMPFGGLTGITAFGHHVPDDGTAFILYGPHLGITVQGELGRTKRPGQAHESASCGALMLALNHFRQGISRSAAEEARSRGHDLQQVLLEEGLAAYRERIFAADSPQKEITEAAYEIIHRQIRELVEQKLQEFHGRQVALLGGIVINTDPDADDWVDVRNFEVIAT